MESEGGGEKWNDIGDSGNAEGTLQTVQALHQSQLGRQRKMQTSGPTSDLPHQHPCGWGSAAVRVNPGVTDDCLVRTHGNRAVQGEERTTAASG